MFENDDDILGLVRKEGLIKPSPDFTSRVMRRIEEAHEPVAYAPLLSRKAWVFITAGFMMVVALCWYMLSGNSSDRLFNLSGVLDRAGAYADRIDFSLKFDTNAILIVTLAIISMGILLSLDLWLSGNRKENMV